MAPTHRRGVRQQLVGHVLADRAEVRDRIGDVGRVPVDDRRDDEVKTRGPELLCLVGPIGDAALLERADRLRQEMTLLGLVEARLAAAAKCGAFQPVDMKIVRSTRPISRSARSSWF